MISCSGVCMRACMHACLCMWTMCMCVYTCVHVWVYKCVPTTNVFLQQMCLQVCTFVGWPGWSTAPAEGCLWERQACSRLCCWPSHSRVDSQGRATPQYTWGSYCTRVGSSASASPRPVYTATHMRHCNIHETLQHTWDTATHMTHTWHTATHDTLQHITHCNTHDTHMRHCNTHETLQHMTHCYTHDSDDTHMTHDTLQHMIYCNTWHTATHNTYCNIHDTLQNTTHCNTWQHTSHAQHKTATHMTHYNTHHTLQHMTLQHTWHTATHITLNSTLALFHQWDSNLVCHGRSQPVSPCWSITDPICTHCEIPTYYTQSRTHLICAMVLPTIPYQHSLMQCLSVHWKTSYDNQWDLKIT